tara:strand:- start:2462 stop:2944 length:483 start_codon:yes stop_codon:yes gene_type:complete
MECGICYETKSDNNFEIFECFHSVCKSCISNFRTYVCPFCRKPIVIRGSEEIFDEININEQRESSLVSNNYENIDDRRIRTRHRRRRRNRSPVSNSNMPDTTLINDNVVFEIIEQLQELEPVNTNDIRNVNERQKRRNRPYNNRWNRINHLYNHAHNTHI